MLYKNCEIPKCEKCGEPIEQPKFKNDKTLDGWIVVENQSVGRDLELFDFLEKGEKYISGEEMLKRGKTKGKLAGQQDAEFILEHYEQIPKEWQKYYLIFAGTIWRRPDGGLRVPYLDWGDDRWVLRFRWVADVWGGRGRLVRCK